MEIKDNFDEVLEKYSFWKIVRVIVWIRRFLNNCKLKKVVRFSGFLIIVEIDK